MTFINAPSFIWAVGSGDKLLVITLALKRRNSGKDIRSNRSPNQQLTIRNTRLRDRDREPKPVHPCGVRLPFATKGDVDNLPLRPKIVQTLMNVWCWHNKNLVDWWAQGLARPLAALCLGVQPAVSRKT